ncbi:unnamed protein product [Pylaiella littoralis]
MAASRRRSGYKYAEAPSTSFRRHPVIQHPPDDYSLIEADLHRATTSLEVASFPFLSQLKLRSAINLSAEPLHDKANHFFHSTGVVMLNPRSLEGFDGPYDLWEEAAKELLQLLLDAENHPMILLDSPTECESACLVGCLRRLQHWSMVAIHDEYHMMTMRNTRYSMSQVFIERFDLDLVTLNSTDNLPPWYRNHLIMLEEEQKAEEELSRRDSGCPTSAWVHGASSPSPLPSEEEKTPGDTPGNPSVTPTPTPTPTPTQASAIASAALPERENTELGQQDTVTAAGSSDGVVLGTPVEAEGTDGEISAHGGEGGDGRGVKVGELQNDGVREGRGAAVPDFRLNGFVYVCPLVSDGCKFTAKAWLQDEDD